MSSWDTSMVIPFQTFANLSANYFDNMFFKLLVLFKLAFKSIFKYTIS